MTRILAGILVAALLLAGFQTWRLDRVKKELVASIAEAVSLAQALEAADVDAQAVDDQCEARVSEARQSARAIERIIEREVHVDPEGCAVRDIVGAGELREALNPSHAPTEPLH